MLQPLYPQGKSPWYPLDRRLGGPDSRSGRGDEAKNSQPLPGLEPPIIQPVAQSCGVGDQINEDEMGGTEEWVQTVATKRNGRERDIRTVVKVVEWVCVIQDRDQWQTSLYTVMKLRVP
jgi:hypothetical protein